MALQLGNTKIKEIYLGSTKIIEAYLGSNKIFSGVDPYNPLGLPPNTVRVRTDNGQPPRRGPGAVATYETATLVPGTTDIYDVYKSGTNFTKLLIYSNVVEVLGANTTGITNMSQMFDRCTDLPSIPLFDTSSVTDMSSMFERCLSLTSITLFDTSSVTNMNSMFCDCSSLTTIPLFNTSSVTNMDSMFSDCRKVQSGALALYRQASSQSTPPSKHNRTFYNCGRDTTTGAAELAQIPSSWGGTGA